MKYVQFAAKFEYLDEIREFVGEIARDGGFGAKDVYNIQLATDEACSNVIEHAYAGLPQGVIDISCHADDGQITVVIHDHGKQFDMSRVPKPNLSKKLSEREVGGLGVFLMHKLMDEIHFSSSKKSGNTLTMTKRKSGTL